MRAGGSRKSPLRCGGSTRERSASARRAVKRSQRVACGQSRSPVIASNVPASCKTRPRLETSNAGAACGFARPPREAASGTGALSQTFLEMAGAVGDVRDALLLGADLALDAQRPLVAH